MSKESFHVSEELKSLLDCSSNMFPKTLVSSCCRCLNKIYSISSTSKKNCTKPQIYCALGIQCVCVRYFLLMFTSPRELYSNLLLEIRLFFFFFILLFRHASFGFYQRFILSSKKTHYVRHRGTQCINSFISSGGESGSAGRR